MPNVRELLNLNPKVSETMYPPVQARELSWKLAANTPMLAFHPVGNWQTPFRGCQLFLNIPGSWQCWYFLEISLKSFELFPEFTAHHAILRVFHCVALVWLFFWRTGPAKTVLLHFSFWRWTFFSRTGFSCLDFDPTQTLIWGFILCHWCVPL